MMGKYERQHLVHAHVSRILEKLCQVEDQNQMLQQKVDEQKNEIMKISIREKEL